jgi:hypothetical protein
VWMRRPHSTQVSQRRLTADWLAPGENDCSRIHSKVSPDWLPGYIKATRPVLEIFKMDGYSPDGPRILVMLILYAVLYRVRQKYWTNYK